MRGKKRTYSKSPGLSNPGTYIYVLGVSLLCWVTGYYFSIGFPLYSEVGAPPLWNVICGYLSDKTVTYLLDITLMLGGAFLLQRSNYALMLIREKTFLPFVVYVLLISTNPDFFPFKSTSIGIFCLILALYQLFTSYHQVFSVWNAYYAALLIGLGSLCWIHILWFIPLFWYGMYSFKAFGIRTFLASLLGVGTIYWFLLGWCVWQKDFSALTIPFATLVKVSVLIVSDFGLIDWLSTVYVALLTFTAVIYIITHEFEESLRTRQYLWLLIVFALFSFLLFFLHEQSSEEYLMVACMPAAILLSHYFTVKKGRFNWRLFHFTVLFLLTIVVLRVWNF